MESPSNRPNISTRDYIDILLAEYDALYQLVTFRMNSLDRRTPITGAAFSASLGGIAVLPVQAQVVYLCGLPMALIWFLRTTANHARSFEDVLRRIDEIERRINELAGADLLAFQSNHPSRGRTVGGRTGVETLWSVFFTSTGLLAACVYFAHGEPLPTFMVDRYDEYAGLVLAGLVVSFLRHRRYRYEKRYWPLAGNGPGSGR